MYVSRVNQLDAGVFDDEIYKVLRSKATEITKYCPPGTVDKWQPELDALLKVLIWNFSLRTGTSTFGQQLLNLRFINLSKRKAALYLALFVLPKYIEEKLANSHAVISTENGQKLKTVVEWIGNVINLLEFVNLLTFLNRGTQPRLIERLLGISSQYVTAHKPRNIGYSYMTRELLWHGLMELFALGLPMINFHYLKQAAKRMLSRAKPGGRIVRTTPSMDLSTKCPYCAENPVLPTHAGCEHIFCYYCLKAHFTAMHVYVCPECGTELRAGDMKNYEAQSVPALETNEP